MIDPIVYFLPVFIILIIAEIIISIKHDEHLYEIKDFKSSIYLAFGASVITSLTKIATLGLFFFIYEGFKGIRLELFGYHSLGWAWWVWILAFLGDDFNFYWYHRMSHSIRFLWAAHVVHHSSKYFNLASGIRNGWTTNFYKPIFWLWMPMLGFHPIMVATAISINSIYQFFLHSKKVPFLGFIENIFNTPKLHQVHHSSDLQYLDKNHGGILIIWDKLFGTFEREPDTDTITFGLPKGPDSHNPFRVVLYEYNNIWKDMKKVPSWKTKLKYVFYAPGWSHDGSTKTAKQLQAGLLKQKVRLVSRHITRQHGIKSTV